MFGLKLLSKLTERVTFVLIPTLVLIFLVLGTIFLGIATPTEGGAMGASGALILAVMKRRPSWKLLRQAMDTTAKLTSFVVFILIGARVFSLTFYGVDGHVWVEPLLTSLPGGQLGFLIVVNIVVFLLAFFLDFFELAFIVVPLLAPVAEKLGIDLIWFGVLLGINMQTSFLHPPFGFALFYLRSVAAKSVRTADICWGALPFMALQVLMVVIVIVFPQIVGHAPIVPNSLPVLPVRDIVVFPYMILPLFVGRDMSIKAIDKALGSNRMVLLVTQKDLSIENPGIDDLYRTGTVGLIMRMLKLPDGRVKILIQGLSKARVIAMRETAAHFEADIEKLSDKKDEMTIEIEALIRNLKEQLDKAISLGKTILKKEKSKKAKIHTKTTAPLKKPSRQRPKVLRT